MVFLHVTFRFGQVNKFSEFCVIPQLPLSSALKPHFMSDALHLVVPVLRRLRVFHVREGSWKPTDPSSLISSGKLVTLSFHRSSRRALDWDSSLKPDDTSRYTATHSIIFKSWIKRRTYWFLQLWRVFLIFFHVCNHFIGSTTAVTERTQLSGAVIKTNCSL